MHYRVLRLRLLLLDNQTSPCLKDDHELAAEDFNSANVLLFGIIMLGMTSSWYDSSSLGLEHLKGARILMRRAFQMSTTSPPNLNVPQSIYSPIKHFLSGFMAYWEAVASFLVDQDMDTADYLLPFCNHNNSEVLSINPLSGISTNLFIYLSQAGSMARQLHHLRKLSTSVAISRTVEEARRTLFQKGQLLEKLVCEHSTPTMERLEETGDCFTPIDHFQTLARVYRLAILLELYRMLLDQEPRTAFGEVRQHESDCQRLNTLAVSILSLIASIPDTSGTRAVQMLALIIAGSTLRHCSDEDTDKLRVGGHFQSMFSAKTCIDYWRTFVEDRLLIINRYIGLDTVRRASTIIRETWKRAEQETLEPREAVHWIDVMVDKGLQTLLG